MAISVYLEASEAVDFALAESIHLSLDSEPKTWILNRTAQGLELKHSDVRSRKPLRIDFCSGSLEHRRKSSLGKNQILSKALGLKYNPKNILDATAGLGKDAFTFAALGLSVTAIEENPLIYLLLRDAHLRLIERDPELASRLVFKFGSAIDFFSDQFDVIYLDPMFPEKKKTALSSGDLQWLQELVQTPSDTKQLLAQALAKTNRRVVVKRPLKAAPLGEPVSHSFRGKSVRYDMYLAPI